MLPAVGGSVLGKLGSIVVISSLTLARVQGVLLVWVYGSTWLWIKHIKLLLDG